LVFTKAGWFPLIIKRDDRARYIESLEAADAGDLRALVAMFIEAQRNALIQASELAYEAKPVASVEEAVAAVRDRLIQRGKLTPKTWLAANDTAGKLRSIAEKRFGLLADQLNAEIGRTGDGYYFRPVSSQPNAVDEPRKDAVIRAGHSADLATYNALEQLSLHARRPDMLSLSFHALGPRYRGIIGVVAYLLVEGAEPKLIEGGRFLINYEEDSKNAETRFSTWLEQVIIEGLKEWRRTL